MNTTKQTAADGQKTATPPTVTADGQLVVNATNTDSPAVQNAGQSNGTPDSPESESPPNTSEDAEATLIGLEEVIEEADNKSLQAGIALKVIQDKKLWKTGGYSGFKAYVEERWNISRSHAHRLINAADVKSQTMGDGPLLSAVTVSVLSVLAEINQATKKKSVAERRKACLDGLLKKAKDEKIRVKDARKAVNKLLNKSPMGATSSAPTTTNGASAPIDANEVAERQELREKIDTLLARLGEIEKQLFDAGNSEGQAAFGELVGLVQQLRGIVADESETEEPDSDDTGSETEEAE
jgi:hypothetical protein